MKKKLHISASFDQPQLLEDMVEELAYRRTEDVCISSVKNAIDTSTTETYVSGSIDIKYGKEQIRMPFITSFLFTCVKEHKQAYKFNWALSFN